MLYLSISIVSGEHGVMKTEVPRVRSNEANEQLNDIALYILCMK